MHLRSRDRHLPSPPLTSPRFRPNRLPFARTSWVPLSSGIGELQEVDPSLETTTRMGKTPSGRRAKAAGVRATAAATTTRSTPSPATGRRRPNLAAGKVIHSPNASTSHTRKILTEDRDSLNPFGDSDSDSGRHSSSPVGTVRRRARSPRTPPQSHFCFLIGPSHLFTAPGFQSCSPAQHRGQGRRAPVPRCQPAPVHDRTWLPTRPPRAATTQACPSISHDL